MNEAPPPFGITATAYRLPSRYVTVQELWDEYRVELQELQQPMEIPRLRRQTLQEVEGVHAFELEPRGELALDAIADVLEQRGVDGSELDFIYDFSTVSRDGNGLSLCYLVQDELRADRALTLAVGNGSCVSLQLALKTAAAMMYGDPGMKYGLLFSEDRLTGRRINSPFNVLGDGASAVLLERGRSAAAILGTEYQSIGKYRTILGIRHRQRDNFDFGEFEKHVAPLHYKYTLQVTDEVLRKNGLDRHNVALVLYQNMSMRDFDGVQMMLGIAEDRVFRDGLKGHGHVFGADLVINLTLARRHKRIRPGDHILLISSGAGFSWGVTLLKP